MSDEAPDFVKKVIEVMLSFKGDYLPVSAFPVDGTYQMATCQWEKRNIARDIPIWDSAFCIQCNKCVMVCPHAAISRQGLPTGGTQRCAPKRSAVVDFKGKEFKGMKLHHPGRLRKTALAVSCV